MLAQWVRNAGAKKPNSIVPNPNESESVAQVVYPQSLADHKGSALHLFDKNVKIFVKNQNASPMFEKIKLKWPS